MSGDSPKHNAAETVAIGRALTMAQPAPARSARALIEQELPDLRVLDVVLPVVFDLERQALLDRRPRLQRFEPALDVGELIGVLALALPGPRPADGRHVRDRIFLPGQIRMLRESFVHHPIEAIALVGVAIDRIGKRLGRIAPEVMSLPGHRAEVADLPEHPFVDRDAGARAGGVEFCGLAAEEWQNPAGLEHRERL